MGNLRPKEFLRNLRVISDAYAEKATELSNLIEFVDDFLQSMPGKVEVAVADESGNRLEFNKVSQGWCLWYGNEHEGHTLRQAPVGIKAEAAILLPMLVQKLVDTITGNLSAVESGLAALKKIPFLDNVGAESDAN